MNHATIENKWIMPADWRSTKTREDKSGLRTSFLSAVILFAYRLLNCKRRWRIGRVLINLAIRLESGAMYSATARIIMERFHGVKIGKLSYGNCFDPAVVPPGVDIGNYVSIAPSARLFVQNHPLDSLSTHPVFYESVPGVAETAELPEGSLKVGNDVWIGYGAIVTPGCNSIGNGAVIAAGAVVTKDVPDFAVVAGTPAKTICIRSNASTREFANRTEWWNLPPEEAKALEFAFEKTQGNKGSAGKAIASVIIPAHDEAEVIGRCLRTILADTLEDELEVIVVCNGCSDDTYEIAKSFGEKVRVLETPIASKIEALNMGDETASCFPRFYVDADIQLTVESIRETCRHLERGDIQAASPQVAWDLSQSSFWVRCFYLIWRYHPYFDRGRLGSGVYALSAEGHNRLSRFPDITADDEFVRQLFEAHERATVACKPFIVTPPSGILDLIKIKTRSRRGTQQLKKHFAALRANDARHQFGKRLLFRPYLWPAACVYFLVVAATYFKAYQSRKLNHAAIWEKDHSSRRVAV